MLSTNYQYEDLHTKVEQINVYEQRKHLLETKSIYRKYILVYAYFNRLG